MIIGDVLEAVIIALLQASGVEIKNKHKKVSLKLMMMRYKVNTI